MGVYVIGEVVGTDTKRGTSTSGRDWVMNFVQVMVHGAKRAQLVEVLLRGDAEKEDLPPKGEKVAYEVEASARVWNGTGSVNWTSDRRARELEEAIGLVSQPLHAVGD